ncbi:MAG: hypothetical protein GQ557_01155 [Mycoplasmataceae bacterium]|nr:hypothetical protein [Mycoplasmataceae bacterium]
MTWYNYPKYETIVGLFIKASPEEVLGYQKKYEEYRDNTRTKIDIKSKLKTKPNIKPEDCGKRLDTER